MAANSTSTEYSQQAVPLPWAQFLLAAVALATLLLIQALFSSGMDRPEADQLRYANYAINLAEHGVFGLSPEGSVEKAGPGNANAPLYPLLVAAVVRMDTSVRDSLICALEKVPDSSGCPNDYRFLMVVQYGVAWVSLLLLWAAGWLIFANTRLATSIALLAALSGVYSEYAERILTEIMILPLFAAIQFCLLQVVKRGRVRWAVVIGVLLGLLTLTRPEGFHLTLFLIAVLVAGVLVGRQTEQIKLIAVGTLVFVLTLSPWVARNQMQFGTPSLTTGGYGETIFAYRLSFNRMDTSEWTTAFVYWLPDFGDKLAQSWLPEPSYRRLISDNPDSFIATAKADILQPALDQMPRDAVLGYWLKTEVFGNPLSHFRSSLPIFWRGLWVAKYWGIIGVISYLVLLVRLRGSQRRALLWFSLPAWLLAILHTGISINIPRYNLPLVPVYALGWGWLVTRLLGLRNRHPAATRV